MGKLKRFSCKQQLTIMFAAIVFLFMFFAMLIVFLGAFLLYRLGLVHSKRSVGVNLVLFAVISLLVGAALSMVFSRFPLAPLRDLMNAIDRIADGDYSARARRHSMAAAVAVLQATTTALIPRGMNAAMQLAVNSRTSSVDRSP